MPIETYTGRISLEALINRFFKTFDGPAGGNRNRAEVVRLEIDPMEIGEGLGFDTGRGKTERPCPV